MGRSVTDETPVAELDPGAGKTHRAYLLAYRSCAGPPIMVFDYCPSRAEPAGMHVPSWATGAAR